MTFYEYKIIKNGIVTKGIEEGSLSDLRRKFIDEGYLILELKEKREKTKKKGKKFKFVKRLKSDKIAEFAAEFSILLDAGINISEAVGIMARNEKNKEFKEILKEIEGEVNKGVSLSQSIKNREGKFPYIFEMALKTGEISGNMGMVLKEMSAYFEKVGENKAKFIGVCIYPLILLVFLVINLIVMSIKVVPVFKEAFSEFQKELPLNTKIIFACADFIKDNYLLLILIIAAIPFAIVIGLRHEKIKNTFDKFLLLIPVVKKLVIDDSVNVFLKSLALLLKSGMTIIESLEPAINTIGNHVVKNSIYNDTQAVIQGKPLYELLKDNRYVNDIAKTLIETGENSAKIDATLDKAALYYDREISRRIDRVNRLIEPALLIIFGLLIGFVVISLALPIFKISSGGLMK